MSLESIKASKLLKGILKYKYVIIVILAGIIILSLQGKEKASEGETVSDNYYSESYDTSQMEMKLEDILSRMEGVGKTEVMLTLKSGTERILAQNVELSVSGAETQEIDRHEEIVIISASSGIEQPVVTKQIMPQYQGAVVVCQGGGSSKVQMTVTEAVSALTGLGSDKIQVSKMS